MATTGLLGNAFGSMFQGNQQAAQPYQALTAGNVAAWTNGTAGGSINVTDPTATVTWTTNGTTLVPNGSHMFISGQQQYAQHYTPGQPVYADTIEAETDPVKRAVEEAVRKLKI